jgi:asparagine synthase (glutamine-hydrolysing)
VWFSSEVKPLIAGHCIDIETFPPGHYYTSSDGQFHRYYNPKWRDVAHATQPLNLPLLRDTFVAAVEKRLMADVPYGVFLSGGLDSSLVASVIARTRRKRFLATGDPNDLKPLKSFSIGLEGSPDLAAAEKVKNNRAPPTTCKGAVFGLKKCNSRLLSPLAAAARLLLKLAPNSNPRHLEVAAYIGTEHYGFKFTVQEGLDAVSDVIYHLETYDITTIRAGTPMFLLSRKVRSTNQRCLLLSRARLSRTSPRGRFFLFCVRG